MTTFLKGGNLISKEMIGFAILRSIMTKSFIGDDAATKEALQVGIQAVQSHFSSLNKFEVDNLLYASNFKKYLKQKKVEIEAQCDILKEDNVVSASI